MKSLKIQDFSLDFSLDSGQFFHWIKDGDFYYVITHGKLFRITQSGNQLYYEGVSKEFLVNFFALDVNMQKIRKSLPRDRFLNEAIENFWGLRILRQVPWECTIAFILSSVSNIKTITQHLKRICRLYGDRLTLNGFTDYSVPNLDCRMTESTLRSNRIGFRSKYIVGARKACSNGLLDLLSHMNYEDARLELSTVPGIGPKIADCILLFAYGFLSSFPVDTWIRRVMLTLYIKKKANDRQIEEFARKHFGQNSGYAQQFLFAWSRQNKDLFNPSHQYG